MEKVLEMMVRLEELKRTARTGWNQKFPPGHRFQSRSVPGAESGADHSWSLSMFALLVAPRFGLDQLKLICMALVHDVAEIVTEDINTAPLEGAEKVRVEAEKKTLEDRVMRDLFGDQGDWGQYCYNLWLDYAERRSPEALALRQLDKLECAIQAVLYAEQGHDLNPVEFLDYAERYLEHPDLREMMRLLRERATVRRST